LAIKIAINTDPGVGISVNAEIFADGFVEVLRDKTPSSYWYEAGAQVYAGFPLSLAD
jgi:hypothetical protein